MPPPSSAADPAIRRGLDYLQAQQGSAGLWTSYWWTAFAYPTYHAMLALTWAGRLCGGGRTRTARAVLDRRLPGGGWSDEEDGTVGAFSTAFALLALLLAPEEPQSLLTLPDDVAVLLELQHGDGSWPARPILRIPESRPGVTEIVADGGRTFTTAAVLRALVGYRTTLIRPPPDSNIMKLMEARP